MSDDRCPTCHAVGTYRSAAGAAWCRACGTHLDLRPREVPR